MAELKLRSEMDKRYLWHLEDMIPSDEVFDQIYADVEGKIVAFEKRENHVAEDPAGAIRAYFEAALLVERLYTFSAMRRDEDGSNPAAVSRFARAQQLSVRADTASSFLMPELLLLPQEVLEQLQADPAMADYDAYIRSVIRQKPHSLSKDQEHLMALAGNVLSGPSDAFGMLENVDMPMPMVRSEDGGEEKLTQTAYAKNLRSADREVRKSALYGMMGAFNSFRSTIGSLYASCVKGDHFRAQARHYASCMDAALYGEEIPVSVYESLLSAVDKALPDLGRYLALRKKCLGVDELHMYDLYVPMLSSFNMKLTYEEAFDLVLEALAPLGKEYTDTLRLARQSGWVDVYENKNKRGGAYSWGSYGTHPFVLLNFTPNLDGASTLAHELGHAMHSFYSDGAQPYAKAGYTLFVAEVASTCNEVLLSRYLMNKYRDNRAAQAFLCNDLLESFRTTVFRQTMFAAFEKRSHEMLEKGLPITPDALTKEYLELNRKYYGSVCHVDEEIGAEWMRIPHFYRNFYVYKYATGFSAAVFIADRILREGEPAVKDYRRFLSAGGSVPPIEALRYAGVDMEDPSTVESALRVFADTVTQMEKLV